MDDVSRHKIEHDMETIKNRLLDELGTERADGKVHDSYYITIVVGCRDVMIYETDTRGTKFGLKRFFSQENARRFARRHVG